MGSRPILRIMSLLGKGILILGLMVGLSGEISHAAPRPSLAKKKYRCEFTIYEVVEKRTRDVFNPLVTGSFDLNDLYTELNTDAAPHFQVSLRRGEQGQQVMRLRVFERGFEDFIEEKDIREIRDGQGFNVLGSSSRVIGPNKPFKIEYQGRAQDSSMHPLKYVVHCR